MASSENVTDLDLKRGMIIFKKEYKLDHFKYFFAKRISLPGTRRARSGSRREIGSHRERGVSRQKLEEVLEIL